MCIRDRRKCVDSLLNQTYDDYIISLVDDGSPDECPVICDEYAINYPEKMCIRDSTYVHYMGFK